MIEIRIERQDDYCMSCPERPTLDHLSTRADVVFLVGGNGGMEVRFCRRCWNNLVGTVRR